MPGYRAADVLPRRRYRAEISVKRDLGCCSAQRGDSLCGQCGILEAPGARPGT
jgi:hypothetical protein